MSSRAVTKTEVVKLAYQRAGSVEYLEKLTGGASSAEPLPLVFALHGRGHNPEGLLEVFESFSGKARIVAPRAFDRVATKDGEGWSWFQMPRASLDGPDAAAGVTRATEALAEAIEVLRKKHPPLGERVIVTGFSQGGVLSFALAARFPSLVTLALPVSGALTVALKPAAAPPAVREELPRIVAFHGDADRVIEIGPARATIRWFQEAGFDAELRAFPGVGHTITPAMRRELFDLIVAGFQPPQR